MFYLKHSGEKLPIEGDNVFTICPECGREHAVDLQEILEGGSADLYGTTVYCEECSARREAVRQGPDSTLQQIAADFAVPEWLAAELARSALDHCLTVDGVYWGVRLALSLASDKGELASVQDIADRCGCTVGEALRMLRDEGIEPAAVALSSIWKPAFDYFRRKRGSDCLEAPQTAAEEAG